MGTSMHTICNTLGIDRAEMNRKLILIEEQHGSNANFVINSVLSNALKSKQGVCLVLFHNTFEHYHNIGIRFGYNLSALRDKGQISVVEPMKIVLSNIDEIFNDIIQVESLILNELIPENVDTNLPNTIVYKFFMLIKQEYDKMRKRNDSVIIIIDDLIHLFDLGLSVEDIMEHVRYLRSLMQYQPTLQLCIALHTCHSDLQNNKSEVIVNGLKYMADLIITIEPLRSGDSSDASGKMTVCWKVHSIRIKFHWPEKSTYLYKLFDWQVKIFAPGTIGLI